MTKIEIFMSLLFSIFTFILVNLGICYLGAQGIMKNIPSIIIFFILFILYIVSFYCHNQKKLYILKKYYVDAELFMELYKRYKAFEQYKKELTFDIQYKLENNDDNNFNYSDEEFDYEIKNKIYYLQN